MQEQARRETFSVMYRAQNDARLAPTLLPLAHARIQEGLRQTRDDPVEHGLWMQPLWFYLLLQDDHVRARDTIETALAHLEKGKASPELIADLATDLSYSLILLGQVGKAKERLRRAIVLVGPHRNREMAGILFYSMGDAYRKTGERLVARRYFELAREIYETARPWKIYLADLKLGSLAREAGDYAEALRLHQRSVEYFTKEAHYRAVVAHVELARDYVALGELVQAEKHATAASSDVRALPEQRIDALILQLQIANDSKDVARAAELVGAIEASVAAASTRLQSELSRPTQQLQFAEQAIRQAALAGDLATVHRRGRAALQLVHRIADDLRAAADDSLAWLAASHPVVTEYVRALYTLDRVHVFAVLEDYYGRQWESGVQRPAGVIGRAFETRAVALFDNYVAAEHNLVAAMNDWEKLRTASDATRRNAARARADAALRARDLARDSYLSAPRATAPSLRREPPHAVLPAIPAGDVFVRYFVQDRVSFGVAASGASVDYFDLPARAQLQAQVQRALDLLSTPGEPAAEREAAAALSRLLPDAILEQHANASRLVIAADDALQPLPFGAIRAATAPHRRLIERYEIVRTKSAAQYYGPRRTSAPAAGRDAPEIVVFADPLAVATPEGAGPRSAHTYAALPNARREAQSIASAFSTRRVATYVGERATNAALLSRETRSARLLHIATHGYFSEQTPDLVGFVTAGRAGSARADFIGLTELFAEPYASNLVVISGCETLRGQDYNGWGVRSVADGFLSIGAGAVIGALWNVSDDATAALMSAFYRELSANRGDAAKALRKAQLALLEAGGRLADPYSWAGVALESSNRGVETRAL
jgi:CHAT domain-containing protein